MRSTVYHYDPSSNAYTTQPTTSAPLNPWDSLWLQAKVDLVLVIPGVQ